MLFAEVLGLLKESDYEESYLGSRLSDARALGVSALCIIAHEVTVAEAAETSDG